MDEPNAPESDKFELSPLAEADVNSILDILAEDHDWKAAREMEKFHRTFIRLANFPRIGQIRKELNNPSLRVYSMYPYLIVYRSEAQPIQIIRVIDARSDWKDLSF